MVPEQLKDTGGQPDIVSAMEDKLEKKPKMAVWKIALPVVLILVLAGGAVAFSLSRNTANTAQNEIVVEEIAPSPEAHQNWLTYTNAKYNFSIEYPKDWSSSESQSGNGATFKSQDSPGTPGVTDEISIHVGQKTMTEKPLSFEEYTRVSGIQEIQNYNKLATFEQITLKDGSIGYKTTWMIQSNINFAAPESESPPITLFEIPGMPTQLLRITSGYDIDPAVYDRMIKSVVFTNVPETTPKVTTPSPIMVATPVPTPIPTENEQAVLEKTIKDQILLKSSGNNGSDPDSLKVTVSEISGDYAKGMASDDGGGGMWLAAKVNGVWKLVWDGNGIITCDDLKDYPNFSKVMIPECYDVANDKSVKR